MDNILIRKLKSEDAEAIAKIYSAITKKPFNTDYFQSVEEHAIQNDDPCFIAEIQGRIIGYMMCYILTGSFGLVKSAWISMVGIHPKYMGQGIGQMLAEEVIKYCDAEKIDHVYTSVRWFDTDVLSFFRKLGFDRSDFINLRKQVN